MEPTTPKFRVRTFVAITCALCGLTLPLTGLANHFYAFAPLTGGRHAWMAAHNAFGVTFIVFLTWHIILNRRAMWNHLKHTVDNHSFLSREALVAFAVALVSLLIVSHAFHGPF